MATSNSRDFSLDVADLIEEAYERCGMIAHKLLHKERLFMLKVLLLLMS